MLQYSNSALRSPPLRSSARCRTQRALERVTAKVQVIGVVQDALIPIGEQKEVYNALKEAHKDVNFISVDDEHGHDAMFNQKVCLEKVRGCEERSNDFEKACYSILTRRSAPLGRN